MISGPQITQLTRRLVETPEEFREAVSVGKSDGIALPAVVGEVLQFMGMKTLPSERLLSLHIAKADKEKLNHLQLMLIGSWLLSDPWFANRSDLASAALDWLISDLVPMAAIVQAAQFVDDGDRREELARLCLKALGVTPAGETETLAQDRLMTISTVERRRVMEASRQAEERARQVREEMRRKAEQAAAAKGSRE